MKQEIKELTKSQMEWIEWNLNAVNEFVEIFSPSDAGKPVSLGALDRAFAAYIDSGVTDFDQVNATINVVGITFGSFFINKGSFQWAVVTDKDGSELAVVAYPESANIIIFPNNFITKRWNKREKFFIENGFNELYAQVKKVESQVVHQAGEVKLDKKPWWKTLFL